MVFGSDGTDFVATSSKDISHVEVHFAGGRVVTDESTTSPNFSYDGNDPISSVVVKSGTTTLSFTAAPPECHVEENPECAPPGDD
ncbi:MAG: hypothetical protein M3144_00865 [Actinomycetota bacterium]|nr:hypothetical protein [Actinomycetota bacterium]